VGGGRLGGRRLDRAARAAKADDGQLAMQLEAELAGLHPEVRSQVSARRILRWGVFVPSYPAGRARELGAFRAQLAPGPVQLAGDYLYGPLMEAAVRAGEEAADRTARLLSSVDRSVSP
jgi:predicted NAD/FAD-dependent oxidoreductase